MATMTELRELGPDDLARRLAELDDQLFRLRLQHAMGQSDSGNKIHGVRRDIARVKTLLREQRGAAA